MSISKFIVKPLSQGVAKSIGLIIGDTPIVPSATYPLDATEAELIGAGLDGKLTVINDQSGFYTYPDGILSDNVGMAAGLTAPHAVLDLSAGNVALEFDVTIPSYTPDVVGGGSVISISRLSLLNGTTFANEGIIGMTVKDSGDYDIFVNDGGGVNTYLTSGGTHRLGILFENGNGVFRVWQDNVELVVSNNTLPPSIGSLRLLLEVFCNPVDDNGVAGLSTTLALITDHNNFTTSFPAGSRDIDGNIFN